MIFGKFQVFDTKRPNLKDLEVAQEHAVLDSDLTRNVFSTSMVSYHAETHGQPVLNHMQHMI